MSKPTKVTSPSPSSLMPGPSAASTSNAETSVHHTIYRCSQPWDKDMISVSKWADSRWGEEFMVTLHDASLSQSAGGEYGPSRYHLNGDVSETEWNFKGAFNPSGQHIVISTLYGAGTHDNPITDKTILLVPSEHGKPVKRHSVRLREPARLLLEELDKSIEVGGSTLLVLPACLARLSNFDQGHVRGSSTYGSVSGKLDILFSNRPPPSSKLLESGGRLNLQPSPGRFEGDYVERKPKVDVLAKYRAPPSRVTTTRASTALPKIDGVVVERCTVYRQPAETQETGSFKGKGNSEGGDDKEAVITTGKRGGEPWMSIKVRKVDLCSGSEGNDPYLTLFPVRDVGRFHLSWEDHNGNKVNLPSFRGATKSPIEFNRLTFRTPGHIPPEDLSFCPQGSLGRETLLRSLCSHIEDLGEEYATLPLDHGIVDGLLNTPQHKEYKGSNWSNIPVDVTYVYHSRPDKLSTVENPLTDEVPDLSCEDVTQPSVPSVPPPEYEVGDWPGRSATAQAQNTTSTQQDTNSGLAPRSEDSSAARSNRRRLRKLFCLGHDDD